MVTTTALHGEAGMIGSFAMRCIGKLTTYLHCTYQVKVSARDRFLLKFSATRDYASHHKGVGNKPSPCRSAAKWGRGSLLCLRLTLQGFNPIRMTGFTQKFVAILFTLEKGDLADVVCFLLTVKTAIFHQFNPSNHVKNNDRYLPIYHCSSGVENFVRLFQATFS